MWFLLALALGLTCHLYVYKCRWKQLAIAEILGIVYVLCLAAIIVSQHIYVEALERKIQDMAIAAIEQERSIQRLTVKVYEFLNSIKQSPEWCDIAPNVSLPEYMDASLATESGTIVATASLLEVRVE